MSDGKPTLPISRAGTAAYYVPSSVIKGMLAGIGLTLILKQVPHAVGYDSDAEGDVSFIEPSGETTLSTLAASLQQVQPGAVIAALLGIALMLWWPRSPFARIRLLPASLIAVAAGVGVNELFGVYLPELAVRGTHLVSLPSIESGGLVPHLVLPDWSAVSSPVVWQLAVTIGLVASLESLLNLEATRKLDPLRHDAPVNRELMAQGVGNIVAGLLGGLPLTGVTIRSSANVDAGARSRLSVMVHAVLMLGARPPPGLGCGAQRADGRRQRQVREVQHQEGPRARGPQGLDAIRDRPEGGLENGLAGRARRIDH